MVVINDAVTKWLTATFMTLTGQADTLDYRHQGQHGYSHYLSHEGTCEDLGIDINGKTYRTSWDDKDKDVNIEIITHKDRQVSYGDSIFPGLPMPDPGCIESVWKESGEIWTYPSELLGRGFYVDQHGESFVRDVERDVMRTFEDHNTQPRWKALGFGS
jgi:hypothetical protein